MPLTRAMAARAAESSKTTSSKPTERPSKRRRVQNTKITHTPKRTKKAHLSRILDMPPEVFNEISTHLLPVDLLSLARANKFFRCMFMSRTSQHIWQQALANVPDMPECPLELSEPQYISLLFSKTCSSCGARVLRRMDPYLYVRLCNSCRDEQILEISLQNRLIPVLPYSDVIKEPPFGFVYTLKSEVLKLADVREEDLDDERHEWVEKRVAEMEKRQMLGVELEEYLDLLEDEREAEIEELKAKRCNDIEGRLFEMGWTKQSTKPSYKNSVEWNGLVMQPKPITDRIWNNLYPKLVPLLESNRTHNKRADRIKKIEALAKNVREALPLLVKLAPKASASENGAAAPNAPSAPSNPGNSNLKVEFPFPSTKELLTWPMIKNIVDDDISPEEAETRFNEIRGEFDRAVVEWREAIERELVEIWNVDRDETEPKASTSNGKGKGKEKATRQATKTKVQRTSPSAPNTTDPSGAHSVELLLPEFIATYTKPDGTPTTDINELSPNRQLLLRADTMFKAADDGFILNRAYPAIVPRAVELGMVIGGPEELNYGHRWNESRFKRDEEASAVAKELLARVGRPDATAVEMKALGVNFLCGRCTRTLTNSWEDLVVHFTFELSRYKRAQGIIRDEPERGFIFHNTHGLEPDNPKPFAQLLTSQESAELAFQSSMQPSPMMVCLKCEEMGISTHCFHTFIPGYQSPILEHIHDVHGIAVPMPGLHFEGLDHDWEFFGLSEEDDNSEEE